MEQLINKVQGGIIMDNLYKDKGYKEEAEYLDIAKMISERKKDDSGERYSLDDAKNIIEENRNTKNLVETKDKVLEFKLEGCVYSEKEITLDELQEEFMDWCDSKGWEYCGMIVPLENK